MLTVKFSVFRNDIKNSSFVKGRKWKGTGDLKIEKGEVLYLYVERHTKIESEDVMQDSIKTCLTQRFTVLYNKVY